MSTVREFAAKNIEHKAPFFFQDVNNAIDAKGQIRQNKKLRSMIKKNHSSRATMSGVTVYVLRVDSHQIGNHGGCSYLAYNEYTGAVTLHNA